MAIVTSFMRFKTQHVRDVNLTSVKRYINAFTGRATDAQRTVTIYA